jgi:membrane-associated protease RseP (regulator of RpoE activity)
MNSHSASAACSRLIACACAALVALSGCGGGGGNPSIGASTPVASDPGTPTVPTPPTTTPTPTPADVPDPIAADYMSYRNLCAAPRTGVDAEGYSFPDRQGTLQDEMKFLRGWTDATYLWYKEIPATVHMADYTNALDYFDALKTPATTASGQPKDRFHFTYTTAEWDALSNASQDTGYGLTWSINSTTAPRTWLAAIVEPGSPAAAAGIQRGDLLTAVDGIDFIDTTDKAQIALLNAGLSPDTAGEHHTLTMRRGDKTFDVALTSAVVTTTPVKNVKVIDTPTGKVGYLSFEDHNAVSELQLVNAFTTLKNQGASDLVLDMRYNGGGLLYIASELAYMVAGPVSAGKTFERAVYNDKTAPDAPIPFRSTAYGFSAPAGGALPYLGLRRVTVLTTSDTCSASEAVINGLRGLDVQVDLIGGTTCGKPYGFIPTDNCGTTYFTIQFQGVNAKGFGDFADGFAPTCTVSDDMAHALGDPAEGMLAAALSYRTTNACPAASTARARAVPMHLARSQLKEIAIYPPRTR